MYSLSSEHKLILKSIYVAQILHQNVALQRIASHMKTTARYVVQCVALRVAGLAVLADWPTGSELARGGCLFAWDFIVIGSSVEVSEM